MEPGPSARGDRQSRIYARLEELIDVVQAQAASDGARGRVEVGEGEELKRDAIAGQDEPAGVAVVLGEAECGVER